jgi:hypothetical protein
MVSVENAVKFTGRFYADYLQVIRNIHSFLNGSAAFCFDPAVSLTAYLQSVGIDTQRLADIKEKYGISERETFNFFTAIDKYWREDFHEIVLLQILNPGTPEIGNTGYVRRFCALLSKISGKDFSHIFTGGVTVESQFPVEKDGGDGRKGRIDILIYDDRDAVIVESKINNAPDQDDQLARYFDYVENTLKRKTAAIAYIRPAGDETKMPPFEGYSQKYAETTRKVRELLVPVSVVDSRNRIDLCHGFLDVCCGTEKNPKAKVFIQQYSDLLKNLGGNKMLMGIGKDIFRNLFADAESVKKVTAIGEVWENRRLILGALLQDALTKNLAFRPDGERYTYKQITGTVSLTFIYDPDWKKAGGNYLFGFSYDSASSAAKAQLAACEDILKNDFDRQILSADIMRIDDWVAVKYLYLNCDRPAEEIINPVLDLYKKLENLAAAKLQ